MLSLLLEPISPMLMDATKLASLTMRSSVSTIFHTVVLHLESYSKEASIRSGMSLNGFTMHSTNLGSEIGEYLTNEMNQTQ